jgi:Mannosyltransferase (PIG-V)
LDFESKGAQLASIRGQRELNRTAGLDWPLPRAGTPIERFFGRARPAIASRVSIRAITRLAGLFIVWRFGILLVSAGWGRLSIANGWPPAVDVMWLFRYSVRWDSGWYLAIANDGYSYDPAYPSSVAFFPLFPLLIRFFDALLPGSDVLAALVVVHLALAGALVYIYRLLVAEYGERIAWRSIYFFLIFPGAFFFSAVYNESLFLLAAAGAIYHARRGQWAWAALFGIFGSATKLVGILLIIPLAVELLSQRGRSLRDLKPGAWILAAPLGAVAYFAYLQAAFGNFRVFFDTEAHWHREPFSAVMLMGLQYLAGDKGPLRFYPPNSMTLAPIYLLFDTLLLWLFVAAGIILWRRYRPTYGAFVLVFTLVPALSGSPQSVNRYVAVLFPAFIILAHIRSEALRAIISIALVLTLAFTTHLFVNGYWAG